MDYFNKYILYKQEYLKLKQYGGSKSKQKKVIGINKGDVSIIDKKKVVIIISGHGSGINPTITGSVPDGISLIFTNHSSECLESNLEMENIIITRDYDYLDQLFNTPCIVDERLEDINGVKNTITSTSIEEHQDYEYYRYNSKSKFKDYFINFNNPLLITGDNPNAVEIMKIGVFQNNQYEDFYKVNEGGKRLFGLSSSNKYLRSEEDIGITNLENLKKTDAELRTLVDKVQLDINIRGEIKEPVEVLTEPIQYDDPSFEKESSDIVEDSLHLRKNFYKSILGNILELPPARQMRLSTLLNRNSLRTIYPESEYDLLVFVMTCRK
jgi:hypothetical protein